MILVVLGVLLISHLIVSARVIAAGRQLQAAKNEIDTLEYKNVNLRDKIARSKGIQEMQERAQEMGFRPPHPGETFYIEVPGYEQQLEPVQTTGQPARTAKVNVSLQAYHLTLLEWVQQQLSLILQPFEEL